MVWASPYLSEVFKFPPPRRLTSSDQSLPAVPGEQQKLKGNHALSVPEPKPVELSVPAQKCAVSVTVFKA